MLGDKLEEHPHANVWLVNTGWTGGPYGEGQRMPIAATRALLRAALDGELDQVEYRMDPIFGFEVPVGVPGVDASLLDPRSTWSDPDAYDENARYLARRFRGHCKVVFPAAVGIAAATDPDDLHPCGDLRFLPQGFGQVGQRAGGDRGDHGNPGAGGPRHQLQPNAAVNHGQRGEAKQHSQGRAIQLLERKLHATDQTDPPGAKQRERQRQDRG